MARFTIKIVRQGEEMKDSVGRMNECAGGDPQAVMAAIAEAYKLFEATNDIPPSFNCGDITGCEKYFVKTISGPSGESVLHVYDEDNTELLGWAYTGIII
jgi:hypothetical protein